MGKEVSNLDKSSNSVKIGLKIFRRVNFKSLMKMIRLY